MRLAPPGSLAVAFAFAALGGCGNPPSPPPTPSPNPGTPETIRGTERLGWDQLAGTSGELATFQYAIYVDNSRFVAGDVSCAAAPGAAGFPCSSRLPALTPGPHTVELAAFALDGGRVVESARSAPLQVNVVPAVVSSARAASSSGPAALKPEGAAGVEASTLVEGLSSISDLGLTPDGRILVAERDGAIRVISGVAAGVRPALLIGDTLLGIAVDPSFVRTRFIFALQAGFSRDGGSVFRLVRYREAGDSFGERAVLLDNLPAAETPPRGTIRVGPDGKLYVALSETGSDANGEQSGRLLRLNLDGTTPHDQPGGNPVVAAGFHLPRGFDWHPRMSTLWMADASPALERVWAVRSNPHGGRHANAGAAGFRLAPGTGVSAVAFYRSGVAAALRGSLLVASEAGLLRVRFDARDPLQVSSVDSVLDGPVRGMIASRDGGVYVATDSSILLIGAAARD